MTFKEFFHLPGIRRFVALLTAIAVLYIFRSMLNLILITFILTYLVNRLHGFIVKRTGRFVKLSSPLVVILIYVALISLLVISAYRYLPLFVAELSDLVNQVISFYNKPPELPDNEIVNYLMESLKDIDLAAYIDSAFDFLLHTATDIGEWSFNLFVALILSLFFLLEKEKVTHFTANFRKSKAAYIFTELEYFGKKFVLSFGKVMEVQFLISLVNSILSAFFLWILGFPNLFALGIMIFLLGLVPVLGVFVSLIPLCAIAFKIGGVMKIVYVLIMIVVLHAIEAYILNPKFMSNKTHLPIFYTFMILMVGEHFFGVWGLIVGVPVFMFFLDLLEVPISTTGAPKLPKPPKLKKSKLPPNQNQ
ncbi:AI-2E family transporter [Paenibacillus sp. CAA11]|uniref:AI-2E family transporter n=1 Tax=Paenibacillus sp. CAA11 TaxID=1532905 RepID=UPI000D38E631|nr:AI-2E family transporter [Paenibacillus sp. CAA11]AWB44225.1 AI-2E family transporter [Paenibacillus sp. CAA11]